MADRAGHARVWRRVGDQVLYEEDSFPNWLLLTHREVLDGLPTQELPRSVLNERPQAPAGSIGVVTLEGANPFRYLVLTNDLERVERHVASAVHDAHETERYLEPISQIVYVRPPVEQYLTISGRSYYRGMDFADVRRLQFDLETTTLEAGTGAIFMVAVRDSAGLEIVLDTDTLSEAELIQMLVGLIRERDPDVIENHSVFDFDIKFLIRRAQALGVPLPLARDGSTFWESRDSVKIGANNDSFTRFSLAGREIVDTLHATRRFSAIQRDLRSNGLKDAARYFGVASPDRVYIPGEAIWPTFQTNPDMVRRYCQDDVEEVDRISQVLMPASFALTKMVPKSYERVATSGTGQGLIEPLLVRAYLASGKAIPLGREMGTFPGARTGIFTTGVVRNVVKADVASLYPSIMLNEGIAPSADEDGIFLTMLGELTRRRLQHKAEARRTDQPLATQASHQALQSAMKVLINSFYGMLGASFALFCDKSAAERVTARGRELLGQVLDELAGRGALLIEADTDGVLFSMPPRTDSEPWTHADEVTWIQEVSDRLPGGVNLEHDGRYEAMYSHMEKNYALLDYLPEGAPVESQRIRLVGVAFRSTKAEPLLERFLAEAVRLVLQGNWAAVRRLYRETCDDLRMRRIPVLDLCVTMPLTKDPQKYAQSGRKEEPYEVVLAAGRVEWRAGSRIRYYQARLGKKLFSVGATDYDPEFYVTRLRHTAMQRLERAFRPEDLDALFRESDGLFDTPIGSIIPLCQPARAEDAAVEELSEEPEPVGA
ncbi:MAG TPA: DNA polymerase domain-containing protein [Chloroflexota bacterium]